MESRLIQPDHTKLNRPRLTMQAAAGARGFSLVEVMVVVAIALVLMAIAIPQMATSLTLAKWRGEMADLSGVFQSCRSQAVKNNQTEQLNFTTNHGVAVAYIFDLSTDPSTLALDQDTESMLAKQKQVWMFSQFAQVSAPTGVNPPPLTKGSMWGGSDTSLPITPSPSTPATNNLCFNSRGIPCTCPNTPAGYCTSITNGYAFYFTQGQQWGAVGVSPAGRIKTYFWNGEAWGN